MLLLQWVINFLIIFFYNIVLAIVGNKEDLYDNEAVDEDEAKNLAKDLNAIFQKTTAKETNGSVDDLFMKIGQKFLNPKGEAIPSKQNASGKNDKNDKTNIKLNSGAGGKQKKKCC